jgi:hypothetical protein
MREHDDAPMALECLWQDRSEVIGRFVSERL